MQSGRAGDRSVHHFRQLAASDPTISIGDRGVNQLQILHVRSSSGGEWGENAALVCYAELALSQTQIESLAAVK